MKRLLAALLLTAALGAPAFSLNPPATLEVNWKWDIYFTSFTSVTSQTVDPAGFGSVGFSSRTPNIVGFSYTVYPVGASAQYQIVQTTQTPNLAVSPSGFNNPSPFGIATTVARLSTSTTIGVPAGVAENEKFEALTVNPVFYFKNLSTAATYFVWIKFGPQQPTIK